MTGLTAGGDVELCADTGDLAINAALSAAGFTVRLTAEAGSVTQTAAGVITAANLGVHAQDAIDLDSAANNVTSTFAASSTTAGNIEFNDVGGFTIGTITAGVCLPTVIGVSAANGDVTLTSTGGITIGSGAGQDIVAIGNTVDLNANGVIEAAGSIINATNLRLQGTGTFTLTQANTIATLAADVDGPLAYNDADGLIIGTVLGTAGITTTNDDVLVNADGALTINSAITVGTADVRLAADGNITQSATGTITADELGVRQQSAVAGSITLDDANDVNTLAASNAFAGGTITFNDVDSLTIGTVATQTIGLVTFAATTGLTTNDGDVLVNANGALTINSAIDAGTADVMLAADGNITQSATGTIAADELGVRQQNATAGSITLDDANDVNMLAASNAFAGGTITFNDVDGLIIGTVATQTIGLVTFAATAGLTTNDGDVLVNADGALTINSAIDAGTADVMLAADGNITQSAAGTIAADELGVRQQNAVAGSITLDDANDVNTLAASNAFAGGTITFNDVDSLTIGTVATQTIGLVTFAATTGLTTNDGDVLVNANGALTINSAIDAGTADIMLAADGNITQSATGTITADELGVASRMRLEAASRWTTPTMSTPSLRRIPSPAARSRSTMSMD